MSTERSAETLITPGRLASGSQNEEDGRMRTLLVLALLLGIASPAHAAVPGALTQLPGPTGCVANHLNACGKAYGLDSVSGLAVSPDGRFVYTASAYGGRDHAVATF